ncbi:hypothetical protein RB614_10775 [Phytohabitans sp. ZYX-F-186]|uniref:Lipoprotein LpqB beta-propeller domain-containing protein n=1 Tax=Phytohabitans maris TaxID=3071409 RepID=A0ABU0ZD76_9ACTN|nr:hypothetical protein [Phytohabitans sp. ZYX-F-186]MDQ7905005.1 hypothetical protein [Phytohabitans sp. ZYX-F-186]
MTARLARVLFDATEQAPPVPPAEDMWRRGRRRRRRRRTAAALACLLTVAAALVWAPQRSRTSLQFAGTGATVLPSSVAEPHLWQRTLDGDPNGPVKLAFTTGHSLNLETALVLVGADDGYRLDYTEMGLEPAVLSPDGRWLLDRNLRDLVTGQTRDLDRSLTGYVPAVWAPDSRTAVGVIMPDGGATGYGPDGEELDGPDDEAVLVDAASGGVRTIGTFPDATRWQAAFSPDGDTIAMHALGAGTESVLTIVDTDSPDPPRTVTVSERQRLAGPAAWTPDGAQILLAAAEGCAWGAQCAGQTWHLQRIDVATGTVTDETTRGRRGTPSVVAWRDGEPIAQLTRDDRSCETVALTPTGTRTLPLTAAGIGCADYARDLLEEGTLGGPGIEPSMWEAQWWAYALVVVLLAPLPLIARRIWRRKRSRDQNPVGHDGHSP